jgi:uncharacterized membrane protein
MALGPIEVLVIGFPGNRFNGAILPELEKLVDTDTINIIDGLLVLKDENGDVTFTEFVELGGDDEVALLSELLEESQGLISDEDIDELVSTLEPNSSAAILVFEHTWSKPFRDAVVDSGGLLVASFRVPGMVVDEVLAELAELGDA